MQKQISRVYPYLIAVRPGYAQWKIRRLIRDLGTRYGLRGGVESPRDPHLTLFGPFALRRGYTISDLKAGVEAATGSRFRTLPYCIDGWEKKEGRRGGIIAFHVEPSAELISVRDALSTALGSITRSSNSWDSSGAPFWYHITAVLNVPPALCGSIWEGINGHQGVIGHLVRLLGIHPQEQDSRPPRLTLPMDALRVSILKNHRILAEYDLPAGKWLAAFPAQRSEVWQSTLQAYRHLAGFEHPAPPTGQGQEVYFIGDTHFGHSNIIRYCARPFLPTDPEEMDDAITGAWNAVVRAGDRVFFIGDLCVGVQAQDAAFYLRRLQGEITCIQGNHDDPQLGWEKSRILTLRGQTFLLIHDPAEAPKDFHGWIIHAHVHNNNLRTYPYIDFASRRINVSAEVVGYRPVSLRELLTDLGTSGGTGMDRRILIRAGPKGNQACAATRPE